MLCFLFKARFKTADEAGTLLYHFTHKKKIPPIYKISSIPSDPAIEKETRSRPMRAFAGPHSCEELSAVAMERLGTRCVEAGQACGEAPLCLRLPPRGNVVLHVSVGACVPQREASLQS